MTIQIEVTPDFQVTATRLLREAGFEVLTIAGSAMTLADGTKAKAYGALADLEASAAIDALDYAKAEALSAARDNAVSVRRQIAGAATTERALGWVLKAVFAGIGQINDQAPNPLLTPLAHVAAQGFSIETELTGEDATAIRDRSVEKASAFFLALQLVEGMERVAESQIEAAETIEALGQVITQLRALEAQALTKLAALTKGGS